MLYNKQHVAENKTDYVACLKMQEKLCCLNIV
jgi:hypothetical protein